MQILPDGPNSDVDFSEILNAIQEMAKDVNILFDELEAVNSPCKDDDSLLHPGNLTSTSEDASRLEAGGESILVPNDFMTKYSGPINRVVLSYDDLSSHIGRCSVSTTEGSSYT
ncbi:Anoctamin-4 [Cricetulus griseus]|uniref:Anoctamin-4 n=1 Tax=Cricetulus griseus TaxID=10029 RepID=G3H686_CRIGR|nr:Anoctamin-4 [Cricetulus griseus]